MVGSRVRRGWVLLLAAGVVAAVVFLLDPVQGDPPPTPATSAATTAPAEPTTPPTASTASTAEYCAAFEAFALAYGAALSEDGSVADLERAADRLRGVGYPEGMPATARDGQEVVIAGALSPFASPGEAAEVPDGASAQLAADTFNRYLTATCTPS
jgi:hypothetical protein